MKLIRIIKASEDLEQLIEDALYLFENDEDHLDYEFIQHMGYSPVADFCEPEQIEMIIRKDPKKAEKFIRKYIN